MPIEADGTRDRSQCAHLEAVGRLLCGLAPYLEHVAANDDPTGRDLLLGCQNMVASISDPASDDYLDFAQERQSLVDAAFLAQAIIRAPNALWHTLATGTRENLINAFASTRRLQPHFNNWLLFSAMIEAAMAMAGEPWDAMRVDYALRQFEQWYCGDGHYSDGPKFRADYYNSFVIHPMLVDIVCQPGTSWDAFRGPIMKRAARFADIQERMIGPDGTFAPIGRSLTYRCGAFQTLAQAALLGNLPGHIAPEQARGALTAVVERTLGDESNFDEAGG